MGVSYSIVEIGGCIIWRNIKIKKVQVCQQFSQQYLTTFIHIHKKDIEKLTWIFGITALKSGYTSPKLTNLKLKICIVLQSIRK
jgi:hypothetical protein